MDKNSETKKKNAKEKSLEFQKKILSTYLKMLLVSDDRLLQPFSQIA